MGKILDRFFDACEAIYRFFAARTWARVVGLLVLGGIIRDVAGRLQ